MVFDIMLGLAGAAAVLAALTGEGWNSVATDGIAFVLLTMILFRSAFGGFFGLGIAADSERKKGVWRLLRGYVPHHALWE